MRENAMQLPSEKLSRTSLQQRHQSSHQLVPSLLRAFYLFLPHDALQSVVMLWQVVYLSVCDVSVSS